ncbi:MAG: hypothetical protein REH79_01270 [Spiroplasma sp.]|nr:hypothetical protein [Spiroplasma sp.]
MTNNEKKILIKETNETKEAVNEFNTNISIQNSDLLGIEKTKQYSELQDKKNEIVSVINETTLKITVIKGIDRYEMGDNIKLYLADAIKTTNQIKSSLQESFEPNLFKVTNIEVVSAEIDDEDEDYDEDYEEIMIHPENLIIKYDYSTIKNQSVKLKVNIISENKIYDEIFNTITLEQMEILGSKYKEFKNTIYDIFLQRFNDIITEYFLPHFKSWFKIEIGYGKDITNIKIIKDDEIFNEFKNKIDDLSDWKKRKEKFYIITESQYTKWPQKSIFSDFNIN